MNYTAYLFDFDYTLANSSAGIVICFQHVLQGNGYRNVSDDDIRRTIGKTLEESFSILTGVSDPAILEAYRKAYVREADVYMTAHTALFPETASVLAELKKAGKKLGIISTKYRYRIRELLDKGNLTRLFDIIVGGEDVKTHKPSPEGLLFAMEHIGVRPKDTLYIGDSVVDAETALAAGVDFAGVTHGVTTAEELEAYPHLRIMPSLSGLL